MKVLKNPVVALLLTFVIVLTSTLVNTNLKFGRLCRDVTDDFYGEDGIAAQLSFLRVDAVALAAVAETNGIDASSLQNSADDLQRTLSFSSMSIGWLFQSYDALRKELTVTEQSLLGKSLSDSDAQTVQTLLDRIHREQDKISASDYNEDVRTFLRRYDRFPTHILAKLAGVEMPELFA